MASNLSSIGFHFADADTFAEAMEEIARDAQDRVPCESGDYLVWQSPTGAEVWFHLPLFGNEDVGADLAGLTPFFSGDSAVRLKLTERIVRPEDNDFEGSFTGWVAPDAETGEGSYPLVFEAVDFAAHKSRALPLIVKARITGFARTLPCFADETAFAASHEEPGATPLAVQAFIPVGMFASASREADEGQEVRAQHPSAAALLTGRVVKHLELTNDVTGRAFHWLVVEGYDATYDIVADPEVIDGIPAEGAIVEVACMLFGRLLD